MAEIKDSKKWKSLVKVTDQQEAAMTSVSPLTVVSAGAGTGKTQTLAYRYAWLLANDQSCAPKDILVLTFTKKAAREMRDRIKKTLLEWGEKFPDEYGRLSKCAQAIEEGYISTIHSFSMKMIREAGLELDIDPTSSVMPAPKEDIWWEHFAEVLSDSSFKKIKDALPPEKKEWADILAADPQILDVVNTFSPENIAAAGKSCSEKLYCAGQSAESLWEHDSSELIASVRSMRSVHEEIFDCWHDVLIPAVLEFDQPKCKAAFYAAALEFAQKWRETQKTDESVREFFDDLVNGLMAHTLASSAFTKYMNEAVGVKLTDYKAELKDIAALSKMPSEEEQRLNSLLCRICAAGWACWDEFRRRERMLTHSDLIFYTSKLLRAAPEYKQKFKHIMIDEFQDTDPMQNELIKSLWNDPEAGAEFQNTLFIVGDQKQSIYRFRHADLTLFTSYIARCEASAQDKCRYISLDQNFRTADGLLKKFNGVFEPLWRTHADGIRYEALRSPENAEFTKKRNEYVKPPQLEMITAVGSADDEKKANADRLRERLYIALGKRIAEMRDAGVKVWNKKKGAAEAVQWRDFAVLVPTRAQYGAVERAFEALGLPYILTTNKSYFGRAEVSDMVNLISLLARPYDPLYLGGWLSSPVSGVEAREAEALLSEALARKKKGAALPLADAVKEKRADLFSRLEVLRRSAMLRGVSFVILEILKKPDFLNHYSGPRRRRVNANLIYLAQLAQEYEASQGMSLLGCAEYLQKAASSEGAKEEPDMADEDVDAIKVMTIHVSKGLEFPVTALFCQENVRDKKANLLVSKKYGVLCGRVPEEVGGKGADAAGSFREKREEREADEAQLRRLLYVGFTRAQDRLILCSAYSENKKEAGKGRKDGFLKGIEESGAADRAVELREDDGAITKYEKLRKREDAPRLTLKETVPARLARLSASAYALLSWCPAAYRLVYRQGRTVSWTVKGGEGEGSDFGSLAHWALARWDFKEESLESLLPSAEAHAHAKSILMRVPPELHSEFCSAQKRAEIRALLERYAKTQEARDFAAMAQPDSAVRLWREMPFRAPEGEIVLVGAADIYWHDSGGIHLRDWKSSDERYAPAAYYESQLEFYAYALSRFYGSQNEPALPVDSAVIYLRSPEAERKVRIYGPADFARIKENIYACAEAALSENITKNAERCAICPWKQECCGHICS